MRNREKSNTFHKNTAAMLVGARMSNEQLDPSVQVLSSPLHDFCGDYITQKGMGAF